MRSICEVCITVIQLDSNPAEIQWHDQQRMAYVILVNETTGEVGVPDIMEPIEADLLNIGLREAGSQWRWFKIEEKEKASWILIARCVQLRSRTMKLNAVNYVVLMDYAAIVLWITIAIMEKQVNNLF